ncbi:DUF1893 domain-containing protein [Bacteroidota bacterium]
MSLFNDFLDSDDTLRIYGSDETLLFRSDKDRLFPLLDYIDGFRYNLQPVSIFDKIMGNAAALLSVVADAKEVYSPLGSQIAVETLDKYGIKYQLSDVVPYIQKPGQEDMCPMEQLSLQKEPEEFYRVLRGQAGPPSA